MKKILTWVLSLTLILSSLPLFGFSAVAETDYEIYIGNIKLNDGDYLIQGASATTTYDALKDVFDFKTGSYAYVQNGTLYLNNFTYNGAGYGASGERPAAIRGKNMVVSINGDNTITCATENSVGFRVGCFLKIEQNTNYAEEYHDSSLTVNATNGIMVYSISGESEVNYIQTDDIEVNLNIGAGGRGLMVGYEGYGSVQVDIIGTSLTVTNIDDAATTGIETLITGEGNYETVNICGSEVSLFGCESGIETGDVNIYDSKVFITTSGKYGINAKKNVSNGKIYMLGSSVYIFGCNNGYTAIHAGDMMTYNVKTMKITDGGVTEKSITMKPITYAAVGGVVMNDGDYLAVGASKTTTTQPSGGYAYYTTDIWGGYLELNNFSYEGEGFDYNYRVGSLTFFSPDCAGIYSPYNLKITSKGINSLDISGTCNAGITVFGSLVLDGVGETTINCQDIAISVMSDTASDEASLTFASGKWSADGLYGARVVNNGLNKDASFTVAGGDIDLRYGVYVDNYSNGDSTVTISGGTFKVYDNYEDGSVISIYSAYVNKYVQNGGNVTVESDGCKYYISVTEGDNAVIEINDGELVLTGNTAYDAFKNSRLVFGEDIDVVEGELGTGYAKIAKRLQTPPLDDTSDESKDGETSGDNSDDDSSDGESILYGDVNGDNSVDSLDAARVLKHDALLIQLSDAALAAADVNKSGSVDSLDAAMILKYDAGIITEF